MTKCNRLVVNGCSYIDHYASGDGHKEIASKLNIQTVDSLTFNGASNQRIIRTTLEDCYNASEPTLYIIGISFIHRFELPILATNNDNDWSKYQSFNANAEDTEYDTFDDGITKNDVMLYQNLRYKFEMFSEPERITDVVYQYTSMIDSIINNNHSVVLFNTSEVAFQRYTNFEPLNYIYRYKQIVDGFNWYSNLYQFNMGAECAIEDRDRDMPLDHKHVAIGQHQYLNDFLFKYITDNNIL